MHQALYFYPIANASKLPEYLQSEIQGECIMAPVLMGDILAALYEDKEGEGEEEADAK
jgi:hypothetical protein